MKKSLVLKKEWMTVYDKMLRSDGTRDDLVDLYQEMERLDYAVRSDEENEARTSNESKIDWQE